MLFLTVTVVHIMALMSPGPDFFFVSQTTISRFRKEAMMGVLGVTCGVMVRAGVALLGLHLVIEKMTWLYTLITAGSGLYLCWMGCQILRGALKREVVPAPAPQVELTKSGCSFLKGLLTNLANPKAIIYFGSVFSLFVGDDIGTTERQSIFALTIAETLAWFTIVISLFALLQMRRGHQHLAGWIDGFVEALFAGFGIHLIISC